MDTIRKKQVFISINIIVVGVIVLFLMGRNIIKNQPIQPLPSESPPTLTVDVSDLIHLDNPITGQIVGSPIALTGEARGYWFFEASFPIKIFDNNDIELGSGIVMVADEWMTEDFIPFTAILNFNKPSTPGGYLILYKDNPSGLPEHDAELRVPVLFDLANWVDKPVSQTNNCRATGCSGQICSDEDVITTCEFRDEYACYKTAKCERQNSGECGWTPTEELVACLGAVFQAESESQ